MLFPLLKLEKLSKLFSIESKFLHQPIGYVTAVDDVSLVLNRSEVLGLVGESGSGKTTLGKIIAGLIKPNNGEIYYQGENIEKLNRQQRAQKIQMIFQDPFASLNPRLNIGTILAEAIKAGYRLQVIGDREAKSHYPLPVTHYPERQIDDEVKELLTLVGMPTNILHNYPHQFSGGQRQRIGIARVLAMRPEIIIADEPVSSLDISVQAQIINLLLDLKDKFCLSYIFITHDLGVVNFIADRIAVMYKGKIIEEGSVEEILIKPREVYTQKLRDSSLAIEL